ncbi:SNF2 family N-terminal domain containing protein, putative [Eimeria necatrix]|uniref:SNF2 family N-terminal domain containing protein, putative n=1 Tax=Eimeria necatrix TaxID=51315 RepID=U6MMB4_9EIME|nr:SNF2 family N-terminal domain containing protein, putative [Eimeria necatrix]CDJ64213.1 SNF2 family N-terminal domain containing protein, putative [Eimeria necatrix]
MVGSGSSSRSGSCGGSGRGRGRPQRSCASRDSGGDDLLAGSHIGAVGRRRGGAMWCHICRDSVSRSEDSVVECTACPKRFHLECLQQEGIVAPGQVVDLNTWLCPQCLEEAEEDEMTNDDKCFLCRKSDIEDESGGKLIMCDGCPHSYHMSCLKLTIEPDEEKWFCPDCNPSAFNTDEIRRLGRGSTAPRSGDTVNSSTCYVCQRPGKLLGCDFCVNSFHPSCLVDVDWNSIGEEWECPVCKGFDPLANQMHKRWTRQEIETKKKERAKNYEKFRSKIMRYRNRFLVVHQKDLGPFVNPKILQALARTLKANIAGPTSRRGRGGGAGGSRLCVERSLSDVLEQLEDEAAEEAEKFTRRAYRSCRHASGRPIKGLPLREGITLKPHQEEGVDWLLRSFLTGGAILADEMGLGKTIQTLCFLSYLSAMKVDGPHLIVVPLSTVGNWLHEIHRFTPSLTHIKICGSRNERQHAMQDRLASKGLYDLYVTTYETVKSEEEFFVEQIPHWQCIVLDEAHRIKNASGAIRHSLDRVQGNMRLLLTGTPLQNNAQELFTLINFLMPDVFRDSLVIEQAFAQNAKSAAGKSGGKQPRGRSKAAALAEMDVDTMFKQEDLNKIRQLLDRVMLRRLKEQAIALPRKVFHDIWLPISDLTAQWYRRLLEIKSLQEEARSNSARVNFRKMLGLVIKMRILCAHPKGVCARESQLQRLQAFFSQEDPALQEEVTRAARELQSVEGAAHLAGSSKLLFLDKLMCHLHYLNCKYVPAYERDYMAHKNDAATYEFYKRHEEAVLAALAEGRKPPRRPKRSELIGIPEYRALLERGMPSRDLTTARDESFLKEGLYAAEPVMPTKESCNPELQERKRGQGEHDSVSDNEGAEEQSQEVEGDLSDADVATTPPEDQPRSRAERRSRRHLIVDEEDLMQTDPTCAAQDSQEPTATGAVAKGEADGAALTPAAPVSQEDGADSEKAQLNVKSPVASEAKREGDDKSNMPTACCTGSPASHKDHKESVDALDAQPIKTEDGPSPARQTEVNETKKELPSGVPAAAVQVSEGHAKQQDSSPESERSDFKSNGGKTAKADAASTPRVQRLLIFTQFQLVLDELEAYCKYRGWRYLRLDGSTNKFVRELDIRDFNNDNTCYFVYLISTRAGGLGINLTAANHVVIYDHDWNPFIDLQAVDRQAVSLINPMMCLAHRIGQQREVHVWSLVSEWTVEERMAFRREQKLRLDKLLVQQQIEEEALALDGEDGEDIKEHRSEKISTDEVRKLMLHGKKAIVQVAATGTEDISNLPLEDLTCRSRQPLPVLGEDEEPLGASASFEEDLDEKNLVDINEVMDEEAEERRNQQQLVEGTEEPAAPEGPCDAPGAKTGTEPEEAKPSGSTSPCGAEEEVELCEASSGAPPKGGLEAELQSAGVLWRSGRERKKPVALYVPQEFTQREERRKLRHETRCFVCGNGKDHVQTSVDREGKPVEVAYGDLVCCSGCPKVYHRCCEGLPKDVKKSWRCRWHECGLCFRKTSQCGNMLVHCARCPTSFCYDCFPPDYCRYNVGEDYYMQLRQRGMNVTPQNWILFLCSKCKAVEEQQTRRRLTKEEKDHEKLMQQELRQQQRQLHLDGARLRLEKDEVKHLQRQRAEEERRWFDHKQAVDRLDEAGEIALRQAYQRLFPAAFLAEIEKRSAAAKAAQRASREAAIAEAVNAAAAAGTDGQAALASAAAAAIKKASKKPTNQLANMKLPSQSLSVCDNCRFPCHGVKDYPGPCCFPDEVIQKFVARARPVSQTGQEQTGGHAGTTGPTDGVIDVDASPADGAVKEGSDVSASPGIPQSALRALASSAALLQGGYSEAGAAASAPSVAGNDQRVKYMQRQVCAACHEWRIGKRSHTRKHCPTLTPGQLQEYDERRAKMRRVAELLLAREPIPDPNPCVYASASPQRLKAFFQQYQEAADKVLEECMVAAGLQHAIASRFTSGKRGVPSPAGYGSAATPQGAQSALPSINNVASNKDRISMILNRSKELLLLKRQKELQVLATLSAANGRAPGASLANLHNEQKKLLMGVTGDGERSLMTPSDTNSEVEVLGVAKGQPVPGVSSAAPADNCVPPAAAAAIAAADCAAKSATGKRHSIDRPNSGARGATIAAAPVIAKRQRKTMLSKTGEAMAACVQAAEMGLPGAGGSIAASAVAAAVKQKSIIDFFTSRNRAAATGGSGMKQPLLAGSRVQGVARPGGMPVAALAPWGAKQASDTESD